MWLAFAFGGPLLTLVDIPFISKLGTVFMCMSFGFVIFGLGLQFHNPNDAADKKVG